LTALSDGGMMYLLAGARANVGQKSGRYMFEAKIVSNMTQEYPRGGQRPKQVLRIGFSTARSSLLIGDDEDSVAFDGEGFFLSGKKRTHGSGSFGKLHTVAVVLNLDAKSPNNNTMALFQDGVSISKAYPLPENLHGKTLYPHVTFRGISVHVNFGPSAMCELPFKCHTLQGAAQADAEVAVSAASKDGKFEVVLPVAFPDEGTFDWLDKYLEKNPKYVELSDRKIQEWAASSGLSSQGKGGGKSNDKPNLGYPGVDDFNLHRVINNIVPLVPRNYVIMEVKSNLLSQDRKAALKRFNYPHFKKIAHVVLGEPNADYKKTVQNKILKEKQDNSDRVWHKAKSDREHKKAQEKKQKERKAADEKVKAERKAATDKRQKAEAEKKAKEAEEKKAKEDAEKKEEKGEEGEPKEGEATEAKAAEEEKKDEKMEEKAAEEKPAEEEPKAAEEKGEEEEEDQETEPPKVELTDEEKAFNFLPVRKPDLASHDMTACFAQFSTPDKAEGFDDIRFEWEKGDKAKDYLQACLKKIKLNTRLESLKPGETFREKSTEFKKLFQEWQDKQKAFKSSAGEKKADEEEDEVDVFKAENILDVKDGAPLFAEFASEDWTMARTRFEFWLLVTSFIKDVDDPDRTGIPKDHVAFYFQKYFSKPCNPKHYAVNNHEEVIKILKDTVLLNDEGLLVAELKDVESLDVFVRLAEQSRRDRQRRIDGGDETARLKFPTDAEIKVQENKRQSFRDRDDSRGKDNRGKDGKGSGKDKGKDSWGKDGWGKDGGFGGKDWGKGKDFGKDMGKFWGKGKDKGKW